MSRTFIRAVGLAADGTERVYRVDELATYRKDALPHVSMGTRRIRTSRADHLRGTIRCRSPQL